MQLPADAQSRSDERTNKMSATPWNLKLITACAVLLQCMRCWTPAGPKSRRAPSRCWLSAVRLSLSCVASLQHLNVAAAGPVETVDTVTGHLHTLR